MESADPQFAGLQKSEDELAKIYSPADTFPLTDRSRKTRDDHKKAEEEVRKRYEERDKVWTRNLV